MNNMNSNQAARHADVIVVGGGAAGMFAAGAAAERGKRVILIEHNERLGKKLYITGKGRCNVTNNCTADEVMKNIPRNGRFLYSALNAFSPQDMMELLSKWGCTTKTERGGRVFPVSDKSADVIDALRRRITKYRVQDVRTKALKLITENGIISGVATADGEYYAPAVILCTGGLSYPLTGSDGSGYVMAQQLGHTVTPLGGSLVPLVEDGNCGARMQGLALKNVNVRLFNSKGKLLGEEFGEMLFTHFGVSGPVILSLSAVSDEDNTQLQIDLKPALTQEKLNERFLREFQDNKNKLLGNVMGALLPHSMIPVFLEKAEVSPDLAVNSITREQRMRLVQTMKCFRIPISGRRPVEEAIITRGGIKISEINPKTMESKLIHGLYFAGEIIDVDAYTGGFNLQIAWATAYCAAQAV